MMTILDRTCSLRAVAGAAVLAAVALGCGSGSSADPPPADTAVQPVAAAPTESAKAVPPGVVVGVPIDPEVINKVVNPKNEAPYSGPTGTLRGVVRVTGDAPPELPVKIANSPCRGEALATHGKLFRIGQGGALADALVAVTGYRGFVPPKSEAAKLTIHGCSLARRTVVATFGQRIEVSNLDKLESYMPYLDGAPVKAVMVAIPGGDAVRLYPPQPGHYLIRDQLPHDYMTADVFVLAYATLDVTALDGQYEITGIPVGPVEVNAMLPATNKSSGQRIEIKPGDNTLDLTIAFDAAKDLKKKDAQSGAKDDAKGAKDDAKGAKPPGPKG